MMTQTKLSAQGPNMPSKGQEIVSKCTKKRSLTCIEKLKVMNSTTGLKPWQAAPTAIPVKPA